MARYSYANPLRRQAAAVPPPPTPPPAKIDRKVARPSTERLLKVDKPSASKLLKGVPRTERSGG